MNYSIFKAHILSWPPSPSLFFSHLPCHFVVPVSVLIAPLLHPSPSPLSSFPSSSWSPFPHLSFPLSWPSLPPCPICPWPLVPPAHSCPSYPRVLVCPILASIILLLLCLLSSLCSLDFVVTSLAISTQNIFLWENINNYKKDQA